ncbi:MAG: hypothetical protein KDA75_01500 [Planctomycetaceae bacterium]|nr:hypothetical protein [Planctomycetaceae bacterium]
MLNSPTSTARMVASAARPVALRKRPDLVIARIAYRGVTAPVIKDPVGLKYYRLQPEQFSVLEMLDGTLSVEQIRESLQREHPTMPVTRTDVQVLINDLHEKGLLISERPGQAVGLLLGRRERKFKSLGQTLLNPLYIRLPGWDPERVLTRLTPIVGWMFAWWAVVPTLILIGISYLFLAVRFEELRQKLPEFHQFFGWPNLLYLYFTMAGAKVLHEFGHGLACKRFGAECHSMGVMLLVFSPTLYCDATDSWMIHSKWKRIAIGAAGMYVEVILSAVCIFVWWNTQPGLLHHLSLNLFFVSTLTTVIFNANPLMRFDGYFMLADFLEIPNLRPKADKMLQQTFAWYCFGIESREDPFMPTSGRGWFVTFAISAFLYRWFITWAIILFLYTVLKPYGLQSIGVTMAVASVLTMLYQSGRNLYQILAMPRIEPLSRLKLTVTLATLAVVTGAILFAPFPWYLEAPFTLQPTGVQHVYNEKAGRLEEIGIRTGDQVGAGTTIARLRNLDIEDQVRRLRAERDTQVHDVALFRQLGRRDEQLVAEERQHGLEQQLADLEGELDKLTITAPVAGFIVAAPRSAAPHLERVQERLTSWNGTPLDPENAGTFLEERTHLCSVAPSSAYEAVLLIDQVDRREAEPGRRLALKVDNLPDVELQGEISDIADRFLEFAPPALSNKHGGPLATTTDAEGREKLTSRVYQATVRLSDVDPHLLRTGMRGNARLLVGRRSLANWIWLYLRNTFKFRL